jgi:hypothetical protein
MIRLNHAPARHNESPELAAKVDALAVKLAAQIAEYAETIKSLKASLKKSHDFFVEVELRDAIETHEYLVETLNSWGFAL